VLHEFLTANRSDLIVRCRQKVARRIAPAGGAVDLDHGIPRFLDQLIHTLQVEQTPDPERSLRISGPSGGGPAASEIAVTAALHGRELSKHGFTVDQVVHDYGDLCQAITDLAADRDVPIEIEEFRTLNRCLDNGIADAVTEYLFQRDSLLENRNVQALNEQLGFLAHELRNLLHTATLAVMAIKAGNVGTTGATGALLDRSLIGMRSLIDRSLAGVRLTAGMPSRAQLTLLVDFIADVKISASLEAQTRECKFTVGDVDHELALDVDREILMSAVGNLLQNAFKFTHRHSEVRLNAYAAADRIRIDVEDQCGGLPQGQ
jgi:signal transduction histidine kinase